jgi:23S rRNA (adenine2503-C2)-methyltransferase
MTTIPLTSRKTLADGFDLDLPSIAGRFDSKDGTQRYLLRLRDGETAESVLIPNSDRVTFCVSSQIGCALGCTFCLTGQMGLVPRSFGRRDCVAGRGVAAGSDA